MLTQIQHTCYSTEISLSWSRLLSLCDHCVSNVFKGKAKKRKNRKGGGGAASSHNNNQSSDRQGTATVGMNASTGSSNGTSTNAGTAENRTSTVDQDGLATEATSENQLPVSVLLLIISRFLI